MSSLVLQQKQNAICPMKKLTFVLFAALLLCVDYVQAQGVTIKFQYDALNRPTNIIHPDGATTSYTYDAVGNRLTETFTPSKSGGITSNSSPIIMQQEANQAMLVIKQAVLKHPEPLVREKLFGWIDTRKVLFAANNILPEMSSSLEQVKGKDQVLLWYNITFILTVPNVNEADKQAYLQLALYHEAVHIDDHFSGRLSLGPLVPEKPMSPENMAQNIWDREWSAITKEWALAKKMKKPYLVPVIDTATSLRNVENSRTFLEGFYKLQLQGNATALNPALTAGFTKRYKQELVKLPPP
jgi:YD repeat-containing protein